MSLTSQELESIRNTISQTEITAILYRLARGLDRRDKALLASCFHEGATDDHSIFKGTAIEFCEWVMEQLGNYERTQHIISNVNIVINGDKAMTESYFLAHHVMASDDGSKKDIIAAGRYLDKFERLNGEWRIMHRKALYDWSRVDETKDGWAKPPISEILVRGLQGPEDLSYDLLNGLV